MHILTNKENQRTNKLYDQNNEIQTTSNWRHTRAKLNRLQSVDLSESGQGDHAAHTNAASSSHRFRTHNAFNKFLQQSKDFARRR